MRKPKPDVEVTNHGSIMLFRPLTHKARQWVDENIPLEPWQWFGDAFACDLRYAGDLAEGMMGDGLIVE